MKMCAEGWHHPGRLRGPERDGRERTRRAHLRARGHAEAALPGMGEAACGACYKPARSALLRFLVLGIRFGFLELLALALGFVTHECTSLVLDAGKNRPRGWTRARDDMPARAVSPAWVPGTAIAPLALPYHIVARER